MTNPRHVALAHALQQVRMATGMSGNQFAKVLDAASDRRWPQSKVWRIEAGMQMPRYQDVVDWAQASGLPDVEFRVLQGLLESATERTLKVDRARASGGVLAHQLELTQMELGSTEVAEYQPLMIPGLAQTADYTREWLSQPGRPTLVASLDVEGIVDTRRARQAQVLDGGRQVVVAINEAALTAVYGSEATHRAQLQHLGQLVEAGRIELLIEPRGLTLAVMRGFELLDDLVSLEDIEGPRLLGAPEVVEAYQRTLDSIRAHAVPQPLDLLNP